MVDMEQIERPFLPAALPPPALPLARYLPPLPEGMVARWLTENVPPGAWVVDPFGSTPLAALEAARAGYRILVASNNPILSYMLEILAAAPPAREFEAAIAALSESRRGEERLERYLHGLYSTPCPVCSQTAQAVGYIWQREQTVPVKVRYHCPACGSDGEKPFAPADQEQLAAAGSDAMSRSRALSRILQEGNEDQRSTVEEALKTYLARPLNVLSMLINRSEGLALPPERKRLLTALLISVCDEANTLWPWPAARPRPRQLIVPPQFHENNLWLALEQSVAIWSSQPAPVPLTHWPAFPPESGGICLFQGRIKSLLPLPNDVQPAAILSAVPRPNQAFWTLCALWSGWLWGRDAVTPLRGALERRRYDWHWMTHALHSALSGSNQRLAAGTPFFAIGSELTPGFLLALLSAPVAAGFGLEGLAVSGEENLAQFWWRSGIPAAPPAKKSPKLISRQAIQSYLTRRGEPANYLSLYTTSLAGLVSAGQLPHDIDKVGSDLMARTQSTLAELLEDRSFLVRFAGKTSFEEGGVWWLAEPTDSEIPLADRLEREVVNLLNRSDEVWRQEVDEVVYQAFPGLLTPSAELIESCLNSYGETAGNQPMVWRLAGQEQPVARRGDLKSAAVLLARLAETLGYQALGEDPIQWQEKGGKTAYLFFVMASSQISRYVLEPQPVPPSRCVLVLPGGRSTLLNLKLRRDPRLNAAVESGWHILKFRHLRQLAGMANLTHALWEELLDGDPPRWEEATQIAMF